jgi:purine nucleosidase/ribosylpyrimidine nucleosidase
MSAQRLVLDVDTGTDDAIAIMLAALHPNLDLVAVTTVNGNVPVDVATENSLRVLDYVGRGDIPVYSGCADPLARWDFPIPRNVRGEIEMHGMYLDIPKAASRKQDLPAASFLVEHFARTAAAGDETVLVATGPLTNLALAMKLDPRFRRNVSRLIVMGGGHEIPSVNASAEFNFWVDPEAAHVVLSSGVGEITMVPLDATHQALVSKEDCRRFRELGTPAGVATATFVERRIQAHSASQPLSRPDVAAVHDALCVACLAQPEVIGVEKYWVDVETCGPLTLGRSVIDTHRRQGLDPNVWVALRADEKQFVEMLMATFSAA